MLRDAKEELERQLAAIVELVTPRAPSTALMRRPGMNVMPRWANSASSAAEVSGDGGTGRPNGMTNEISQAGAPRAR